MARPCLWRVLACSGVIALAVLAQRGPYEPYQEKVPDGLVNWDEGWLRADVAVPLQPGAGPQARVNAQRVAIVKAQAAALRIALRLPVNADQRLEAYEALQVRVKGVVAGGQVVSEGLDGQQYRLSLKVPIAGVKGIVAEVSKVTLPPPEPNPPPQAKARPAPPPAAGKAPPESAAFASVTVDAREAGVKPALQPRIVDTAGNEVYGLKVVRPEVAREKTLARYVAPSGPSVARPTGLRSPGVMESLPLALITPPWELFAQREPSQRPRGVPEGLEVKALSASGKLKADIVVTEETARRLRQAEAESGVLSEANVVVVVRPDVGGVEGRLRPTPRPGSPEFARR